MAPTAVRPQIIKSKDFNSHVENLMKEWKVPGLALAVVDGDESIVKVCCGRLRNVKLPFVEV